MLAEKEMEEIFKNEIPLEGLEIDSGIYDAVKIVTEEWNRLK